MKKLIRSEKLRPAILVAVLALIVALNAAAGSLGHIDLSSSRAATLSGEALAAVRALNEPVEVYMIESDGHRDVWLDEIVDRMAKANANLTVEIVAPDSPRLETLAALTDQTLAEGNVLVASGKRSVVLTASELYDYEYDQSAYYYYGVVSYTRADFTAQDALCRAFKYVTRDDLPVLYALTGHGESGWDGALNSVCFDNNIAFEPLTLAPGEAIPEDAAAVMVCGPTSPVGAETATALLDYLKSGGDVLLLTNYTTDFTGLDAVVDHYGMARKAGLVLDSDAKNVYSADYKYFLKPELRESGVTNALIEAKQRPIVPVAEAIVRSDVRRAGLNARPILTTSEQGYMKLNTDAIATLEQEPADETGRFILGMDATDGDTRLVWIGAISMFAETNDAASNGANSALAVEILKSMIDCPPADEPLPAANLLAMPAELPMVPALICLAALPLICLVVGLVLRRRRG